MNTEIEAKFLDINVELMRQRLQGIGATCEQPMRLMRRRQNFGRTQPLGAGGPAPYELDAYVGFGLNIAPAKQIPDISAMLL